MQNVGAVLGMKELRYQKILLRRPPLKFNFLRESYYVSLPYVGLTVMELETSENDKLGIVWDFSTEVLGFQLGIFVLT